MIRDTLTKIINKSQETIIDKPRDYIGASSIGSDCMRKIWYEFKGEKGESVPPKTRRTWDIGKILEGLVIGWLKDAGVNVESMQADFFSDGMPFFKGHFDGLIVLDDMPYVLEIKTAKDASFKIFNKDGLKLWNPQYYAQIQSYLGMSGINSAYILVLNKDNSELSDELVAFNYDYYKSLQDKAWMIAHSLIEPPRISGSPFWYACKLCKFNKVCHG